MSESFIESIFYKRGSLNSASYLQVNTIHKHRFVSYVIKCLLLLAGGRLSQQHQWYAQQPW